MTITSQSNFSKLPKKPEILVLELQQVSNIDYLGVTLDQHLK